ncbi:MAG: Uma2 family endonuclease [Myxococcales bacterium]|nr:Uma2 family endonuclease [Myxococcales bacterium]
MRPLAAPATYDDIRRLPSEVWGEVIAGQVLVSPSPKPRHGRTLRSMGRYIGGPFDDDHGHGGPGGWWIVVEVDVRLSPHDIVRPDLSGWRRERLDDAPWDDLPVDVVPDWICEILSPHNAAHDRVTKRRLYAAHGVPHYWLVDPATHTLEALRLVDGLWVETGSWGDGDVARVEPFEAIELDVGRLFVPQAPPSEPS